jgi:ubiquilin
MGGSGMDAMAAQMMANPQMQELMSGLLADPNFMQAVMASNPQLAALQESIPGMRAMMADPAFLQMMTSPEMMAAAQQMMQVTGGRAP